MFFVGDDLGENFATDEGFLLGTRLLVDCVLMRWPMTTGIDL